MHTMNQIAMKMWNNRMIILDQQATKHMNTQHISHTRLINPKFPHHQEMVSALLCTRDCTISFMARGPRSLPTVLCCQ